MTVEEAIEKSSTKNILAKGSIKKAQQMIEKGENVLYAINTNVIIEDNRDTLLKSNNKGLFSVKNALNGVVVITDRRVIFCSSIIGNIKQKQILIKDIMSIDKNINVLTKMGQLRIQGITESFVLNIYKEKIATEIESSIYNAQSIEKNAQNIEKSYNMNKIQVTSNADEIMKFKQLLDEGIISQEEFEKKKQDLLK